MSISSSLASALGLTTANTVKVDTATSQGAVPKLSVGDVLNVTVVQNLSNGQGMLNFQGTLISAKLPEYLMPGDALMTKVAKDKASLLFKILEIRRPIANGTVNQIVGSRLEQFFVNTEPSLIAGIKAFEVPRNLSNNPISADLLKTLESSIGNSDSLSSSINIERGLDNITSGVTAKVLKDLAATFNKIADSIPKDGKVDLATLIKVEMTKVLSQNIDSSSEIFKESLNIVDNTLSKVRNRHSTVLNSPKELQTILEEIMQDSQIPPKLQNILPAIFRHLDSVITNTTQTSLADTSNDLKNLAARLEGLANSLEMLNQLNPLMNALGEPVLLLFPSLFQGFLNHCELLVQSRNGGNSKNYKNKKQSKKGNQQGQPDSSPYQRVQLTVPLPAIGVVGVDMAHREKEILVRLTVKEENIAKFLVEQLEHLAIVLKGIGFETTELVANVGEPEENITKWCSGLHSGNTVIA